MINYLLNIHDTEFNPSMTYIRHAYKPRTEGREDQEFKVSLHYTGNLKTAWAICNNINICVYVYRACMYVYVCVCVRIYIYICMYVCWAQWCTTLIPALGRQKMVDF